MRARITTQIEKEVTEAAKKPTEEAFASSRARLKEDLEKNAPVHNITAEDAKKAEKMVGIEFEKLK